MKGDLSLELVGVFTIVVVGVLVGVLIVMSFGSSGEGVENHAKNIVEQSDYPICGDYRKDEKISKQDFQTLVYAQHIGQCNRKSNEVTLGFTLTKGFVEDTASQFDLVDDEGKPLVLYRDDCNIDLPDFQGLVVGGSGEKVLISRGSGVKISKERRGVFICLG